MDDYVPKPFKPGELRERVEYWAREKRVSEEPGEGEPGEREPQGPPVQGSQDPLAEAPEGQLPEGAPVRLEEFRAAMRDAGIESVVDAAVEAYFAETPRRMKALEAAVEAGDWKAVEREAHGIKSGSKNLRADHFGNLLEEMEQAGRDGREADVRDALPDLRRAYQQVMDYLKGQGPASE